MTSPIPTIHLDDPDRDHLIQSLREACIEVGFFYLEGHGMDQSLFRSVREQVALLFDLPLEEKQRISDRSIIRGYLSEEVTDPAKSVSFDTKEAFDIGVDGEDYHPDKLTGPNTWPSKERTPSMGDGCEAFRSILVRYRQECMRVSLQLVQCLALAIGLEDQHCLDSNFDNPIVGLRLLRYDETVSRPEKGVFAAGAHTDLGILTLLLTDSPGLQIQTKKKEWLDVPPRETAFVVNLGDMLEWWTNGLFASTKHRVLTSGKVRYSVPFFYKPNFETLVKPLDVCCTPENPPRYQPTCCGEYHVRRNKGFTVDSKLSKENNSQ